MPARFSIPVPTRLRQGAAALVMLGLFSLAQAAPTYVYKSLLYGDSAGVSDLNDHGIFVWSGFCDGGCDSRLDRLDAPASTRPASVSTYQPSSPGAGPLVSAINNAGDMLGKAWKNGAYVSTLWKGGVLYDLTDPLNAGMQFEADPGPQRVPFDLYAFEVANLPENLKRNSFGHPLYFPIGLALTNSRGDYIFEYGSPNRWGIFGAITLAVPEPSTLPLVAGPLLLAAMMGFGRRTRRPDAAGLQRASAVHRSGSAS